MIKEELRKTYFKFLFPIVILLVFVYLGQLLEIIKQRELELNRIVSGIILVLVALFGIALPIFYRALFVNKIRDRKSISVDEFLKFEKKLLVIAMIAPYFIVITILLNLPGFYYGMVVIIALYAVYYYFPSEKRIKFEKRLFRISEKQ
jgi:heme/copper-type cytochrome/quinol oxidase subunit 2